MLPAFAGPVRWCLGAVANDRATLRLLRLERSEFEAVLGQCVIFDLSRHDHLGPEVWAVKVDPSVTSAVLKADLAARRMLLVIHDASHFMDGINLLHSLAYSPAWQVADDEAATFEEAFDRIRDEVANIFPSLDLRGIDWDAITARYEYVRDLEGDEFWDHAQRWVAELGDAHTQLYRAEPRFHPPYLASMQTDGAHLLEVPEGTDAWNAGVRPGDILTVGNPAGCLRQTGATPQQKSMIAARRFMAMSSPTREFTVTTTSGRTVTWTEAHRNRPSLVATGNTIKITSISVDLPALLHQALGQADPTRPLILDVRGNVGGDLAAAVEASRLLIADHAPFGYIAHSTGRGAVGARVPLARKPHPSAWPGPLEVHVDAMTYSAAEDLIHPLVGTPRAVIIGPRTGGGSGRPHSRRIKDGRWLATSTAIAYDRNGAPIEYLGIQGTAH